MPSFLFLYKLKRLATKNIKNTERVEKKIKLKTFVKHKDIVKKTK